LNQRVRHGFYPHATNQPGDQGGFRLKGRRRPKKLPKIRLIAQLLRQPFSAINISPPAVWAFAKVTTGSGSH